MNLPLGRWTLLPVLALLAACSNDVSAPDLDLATRSARSTPALSATGEYLVMLKGASTAKNFAETVNSLGGTVVFVHEGAGIASVAGLNASAVAQLAANAAVQDVQPNAAFTLDAPLARMEADGADISVASVTNPTTSILYGWQWNMRLIDAPAAWAAGKLGSSGVTIAIIDSGIDYTSLDLNGLVDLSRSTSFVPSDDSLATTYLPSRNKSDDFNGHGTSVATQASSKAVVFAGVTSRSTLMSVKAIGRTGSGNVGRSLLGLLWAADHGANVANMSLGGVFAKNEVQGLVPIINRVMNYAHAKGLVVVVAAGNEATDLDHNGNSFNTYCNATHVICVSAVGPATATDNSNAFAFYSNFGKSAIDVAAPGGNADAAHGFATSVWPWGTDIASWVWSLCARDIIASLDAGGAPVFTSCKTSLRLSGGIGTSSASPHVAGLAALILAEHPGMTNDEVKDLIMSSTDDKGPAGFDAYYGTGRINVAKALGL